jgi:uncharacterized protein (TIGR02147 family)
MFAAQLGLSHSFVSQVFAGKKSFPVDRLDDLVAVLELDEFAERRLIEGFLDEQHAHWKGKSKRFALFLKSAAARGAQVPRVYDELPTNKMTLLSNWYNLALLDLLECPDFRLNYQWIADRLNINSFQAQAAWTFLKENGLVQEVQGRWKKTDAFMRLPVPKGAHPVREHYLQLLQKMQQELKTKTSENDRGLRLMVGASCTANMNKWSEVKQYLEDSLYCAAEELAEGECEEVYYLMVSAIPLTQG